MIRSRSKVFLCLGGWIVIFTISLALDRAVSSSLHTHGIDTFVRGTWWAETIKLPGNIWFIALIGIGLMLFRKMGWKEGVFVLLCVAASGVNSLIKWIAGRPRPFVKQAGDYVSRDVFHLDPFIGGISGLFNAKDLAFPSGHACTAFAAAAAFSIVVPKVSGIAYAAAMLVAIERVAENAHSLSDAVAAAAIGIMCAKAVSFLLASLAHKAAAEPLAEIQRPVNKS